MLAQQQLQNKQTFEGGKNSKTNYISNNKS